MNAQNLIFIDSDADIDALFGALEEDPAECTGLGTTACDRRKSIETDACEVEQDTSRGCIRYFINGARAVRYWMDRTGETVLAKRSNRRASSFIVLAVSDDSRGTCTPTDFAADSVNDEPMGADELAIFNMVFGA